jgi:hypothetical protein
VKGKAVFVETMQQAGNTGGVARAGEKGAAVVFQVSMLPGNMRMQDYPARGTKTACALGNDDGNTARTIIEKAGGQSVKIKVHLTASLVPGLSTGTVWGTLPASRMKPSLSPPTRTAGSRPRRTMRPASPRPSAWSNIFPDPAGAASAHDGLCRIGRPSQWQHRPCRFDGWCRISTSCSPRLP